MQLDSEHYRVHNSPIAYIYYGFGALERKAGSQGALTANTKEFSPVLLRDRINRTQQQLQPELTSNEAQKHSKM